MLLQSQHTGSYSIGERMNRLSTPTRVWIIRLCICAVTAWNLQAAFSLLIDPSRQSRYFMVEGQIGIITVISFGILFVMWNIPYIFAIIHPIKWNILLKVILLMQLIGVIGEIWIFPLARDLASIRIMIQRFIMFDTAGLVLLGFALYTSRSKRD